MEEIAKIDLIAIDAPESAKTRKFLEAHGINLKPNELEKIRRLLGRDPTLVELHIFNTMWSEHCSYKSSKPVLRKYLPTEGPHVILGPGEDAGIVRFAEKGGKKYCLVMAHESHNHPSQVLPVEGAATGIGGIVRDVYCMGADVVGVLDPLRFGDPNGPNGARVRDIALGVVEGIAQYGNPLGVPNLGGETIFDASFDDNCLVNVIALGIVEEDEIIRSRVPDAAHSIRYKVLLIGKPTDASGFGGAAFASERLSGDEAAASHGAVQIPDPFLKRVLAEGTKKVLEMVRREGLRIGFKDLGAGGISCAVSEMAAAGGKGVSIDLDSVNCANTGMAGEVIACSETQERYAMVVPEEAVSKILHIYNEEFEMPGLYTGAGAFVIGSITQDKRFRVVHRGKVICDADVDSITAGIEYERKSLKRERKRPRALRNESDIRLGIKDMLLDLLSRDNIADKELVYCRYDSEVQGRAVLRPGEADAAVQVFIPGDRVGLAAGVGGNSSLSAVDPYLGGVWAVCEAVRNIACVGAVPVAITDCLNYGDPEDPGVFWEFSEGVRGIGDACRQFKLADEAASGIPVISGNVSFYNQSEKGDPIAPSPIVACAGRVDDINTSKSMGLKKTDSKLVLIGRLHARMGGSEFEQRFGSSFLKSGTNDGENEFLRVPEPDLREEKASIESLLSSYAKSLVLSAHDISQGGILVTVAEMMNGGVTKRIGCSLDLREIVPGDSAEKSHEAYYLFGEYGGIVTEIAKEGWDEFRGIMEKTGAPWATIGSTDEAGQMRVQIHGGVFALTLDEMSTALKGSLGRIFGKSL